MSTTDNFIFGEAESALKRLFEHRHGMGDESDFKYVHAALVWLKEIHDDKPVCEVCGEEESDRILGKVDRCGICYASLEYRIEQLTFLLQKFAGGESLERMLPALENAGIRKLENEPVDPAHPNQFADGRCRVHLCTFCGRKVPDPRTGSGT